MFITIEGGDGSGKSTLAAALADRLTSQGKDVLLTKEPGGTPIGEKLRAIFLDRAESPTPLTETLILSASRAELVDRVIRPALKAGQVVICDRFTDATLAYQGSGRGIPLQTLRPLIDIATGGLEPDLTLLLDLPTTTSRERFSRAPDRIEAEDEQFHERVRGGYLDVAGAGLRCRVIDATQSPEAVLARALKIIDEFLFFYKPKRANP